MLNTSRNIGMNIGMTIVQFLSPILLLRFSAAGAQVADSRGYLYTAIIYSIISIPMFLIVFFTSKEVVQPSGEPAKFSVADTIKNLGTKNSRSL